MAGEILCPDCGGVVGATETTSAGPPCSCFITNSKSETAIDMPSPAGPGVPKLRGICGNGGCGAAIRAWPAVFDGCHWWIAIVDYRAEQVGDFAEFLRELVAGSRQRAVELSFTARCKLPTAC